MKVWTRTVSVLAASLLVGLTSAIATADPLHPFGNEGAWRHEYSGWQFTKQVGDFSRAMAPYTIDGNNDVGVRYENPAGLTAVVEVYLADSAATDAKLDGAKASAGKSAQVGSERPFRVGEHKGVKVTYEGTQTALYFFKEERWSVKVLGNGSGKNVGKALDDFVRKLPWDSLGDPTALH